jgi:Rieske Fe-S protein
MNRASCLALVVAVGAISACASRTKIVDVPLDATPQNATHIARATLSPVGDHTGIVLTVGGVPHDLAVPSRLESAIYAGSCQHLGAQPAYQTRQANRVDYPSMAPRTKLWAQAPVALSELTKGDYALLVRSSPADGSRALFCGNISAG